jgi:uncharacterized membrane protein YkoI
MPALCTAMRPLLRTVFAGGLVAALVAPAEAEDRRQCLSRAEQRAAIAEGAAIALAAVRRMVARQTGGELVRARLCHDSGRLIYLLTVLTRDGKVRRVTVDATNGSVIGGL